MLQLNYKIDLMADQQLSNQEQNAQWVKISEASDYLSRL